MPVSYYTPEYPSVTNSMPESSQSEEISPFSSEPLPLPFRPYVDPGNGFEPIERCYLDPERSVPAPDIYAYSGVSQFHPLPVFGSYDLINLQDNVCFDRYGRYGPYGLGYSVNDGGIGKGIPMTPDRGVDHMWEQAGRIDYRNVNLGDAQYRCYQANKHRFIGNKETDAAVEDLEKRQREAVVMRTYTGYKWTHYAILNTRAMISEASLNSGGQYDVHLLLHVRGTKVSEWDDEERQKVLNRHVPKEFHSLCTLWSEAQMEQYYTGDFGHTVENISHKKIHSVYRSASMPLQHFAVHHPQYAHFWNWEVDVRYIGSYHELFSRIGEWAQKQSRKMIWERSSSYYIPAFHGSWKSFSGYTERDVLVSGRQPILGPTGATAGQGADFDMEDHLPESCRDEDTWKCGVDEPADLVTLNPIFDVQDSGWVFSKDITGYNVTDKSSHPPRRSTIVTASRLSRRLLNIMHHETKDLHHAMFTEMFPPSIALHYGLKAVYAPHPVYLDRAWSLTNINRVFNGGKSIISGGSGSPFDRRNEHNHKGSTWYYHAEFAGQLWRRWLGVSKGERKGNREGSSRLCLRSMLIHPVKWEEE